MPNWCNNFVEITGNISELKKDILAIENKGECNFFSSLVGKGYIIFEGYNHYKNIPLYQVLGKPNQYTGDWEYTGEWHESREDAEKELKEQYDKDWYDTNCNYWGTKWDISVDEAIHNIYDNQITLSFDSAWSPPINFCKLLSGKYRVKVDILYSEAGSNFTGKTICENGEIVDEEDYTYIEGLYFLSNEEFWYEMEYRIEQSLDEEQDIDEFIAEFPFLEETCKGIAIKMYQEEQEKRNPYIN